MNLFTIKETYLEELTCANAYGIRMHGTFERPFIGVIIQNNDIPYFIPLTSVKPKHHYMKNNMEFHKIMDNNQCIAALNFTRMIPVPIEFAKVINIDAYLQHPDRSMQQFGTLLQKELAWINKNHKIIENKAHKIYMQFKNNTLNSHTSERINNFIELEDVYKKTLENITMQSKSKGFSL